MLRRANDLPHGSLIFKENFSSEKKLMAITLMDKSKGYNPDGGDCDWAKFGTDGKVAQMDTPNGGKMAVSGKPMGCVDCHAGSDGDDYAFFND